MTLDESHGEPPGDEPRRGRPRDPAADRRILEAAVQLLLDRGVQAMTVDDVAEAAGVGKATVYRRWTGKDDLALAAVGELFHQEVRVPDNGSLLGDITEVYEDLLRFAGTPAGMAFFRTAAAEAGRDPRIAELYRVSLARRQEISDVIFERAIERGELDPDVDRRLFFDWPAGVLLIRIVTGADVPDVSEAAHLAQVTVHGFARTRPSG